MTTGCLYKISFPNGKAYVGVTMQPLSRRLRQHRRVSLCAHGAVARAMRKYGPENTTIDVLAISDSKEYLALIERRAVEAYGTLAPSGYNLVPGGHYAAGVYAMPEEQKERRRGRKASAETRAKMSAAKLGLKRPASYSEKLAARNVGNKHARGRWLTARGVKRHSEGKWEARICMDRKQYYLGLFVEEADALAARAAALAAIQNGQIPERHHHAA